MAADDYIKLVQTVGFPIVICGYFIWREVRKADATAASLAKIAAIITIMASTLSLSEAQRAKVERLLEEEKS
jgi:hypothetical protein